MNRNGSVLVAALIALLVLNVIIVGTMTSLTGELSTVAVRTRQLQSRLSAESAVRTALAAWDSLGADTLEMFERDSIALGPDSAHSMLQALGGGRYLLAGHGARGQRALAFAAVTTLPSDTLRTLFTAAFRSENDVSLGARAHIDGLHGGQADASVACPDHADAGVVPALVLPAEASLEMAADAILEGSPLVVRTVAPQGPPRLAGITLPEVLPLADRVVTGSIGLDDASTCEITARCADGPRVIVAPGDLRISGGTAELFAIVLGTLTIDDGVVLRGAVLAGALRIGDAEVHGAVRTFAGAMSVVNGVIRFDACALERALGAPALRRPFQLGPRLWLPAP